MREHADHCVDRSGGNPHGDESPTVRLQHPNHLSERTLGVRSEDQPGSIATTLSVSVFPVMLIVPMLLLLVRRPARTHPSEALP